MIRLAAIIAVTLVAAAGGQNEQPVLTPDLILREAQASYRAGPIAEELRFRLTRPSRSSRTASLILRLDARHPSAPPTFRLEFDNLIISAHAGALAAAHTDNENDRWLVPGTGADIAASLSQLPPLPIPELHLAFDPDARLASPTPYTPGVVWDEVRTLEPRPGADPSAFVLTGRSESGPVQAVFDAASLRLQSFHAGLDGGMTLDLTAAPVSPVGPASWPVVTDQRQLVPSLSDLRPQRGPITPGQFLPDLAFTQPDNLTRWSLHEALGALPPPAPGGPAPTVAIIVFRIPADPVALASAEASARLALQAARRVPAILDIRLAAAIDLAQAGEQVPALRQRWEGDAAAPGWTTPAAIIDRFDRQAPALLILIARDRRLLGTIPLDQVADAEDLGERIASLLSPAE